MPVDIVQWRGEIGTFNNRKKIYFYKRSFCLFSALIYTFVWLLLQIFSMVRFTVNLICFAINSRLFFFAITRIFRKVRLQLITLLYSVMIVNVILWYFFRLLELSGDIEFNPGPKPPYERTIFHYSQANVDHIQQAINLFDWENVFLNIYYNNILDTIVFSKEDIYKIIKNLDPNKAHGHDMISIRMIKLCGISICKPLEIIFQNCLRSGKFPSEWKKANVVPTFKKGDKQCIKNYRPVSLLPVCGKVFERLLYNKMFSFFSENDLISLKQSGFRPGDSCTNQLLSIAHEILSAFDDGHEVRGVFLDISKAFDRVWHEGLLFKLQQYGISGELITLIKDFLSCRKQRVVLNGQHSSWADVKAGVPQGSILGPLLFLIYINDLTNGLNSNVKLFPDDTSLFSVVHNITDSANLLNSDLSKINEWALQWKMSFNPDPIKQAQEIIFSRKNSKRNHPSLTFNNNIVNLTTKHKHLGMIFDSKLSFDEHLKSTLKK